VAREETVYSVVLNHGVRVGVARELVPMATAFTIAEAFYKFHSFSLETLAFLGTWFVLSGLWNTAYDAVTRKRTG